KKVFPQGQGFTGMKRQNEKTPTSRNLIRTISHLHQSHHPSTRSYPPTASECITTIGQSSPKLKAPLQQEIETCPNTLALGRKKRIQLALIKSYTSCSQVLVPLGCIRIPSNPPSNFWETYQFASAQFKSHPTKLTRRLVWILPALYRRPRYRPVPVDDVNSPSSLKENSHCESMDTPLTLGDGSTGPPSLKEGARTGSISFEPFALLIAHTGPSLHDIEL
ncbi:2437_t:CDS:2, partial [Acaulospora colombiana]